MQFRKRPRRLRGQENIRSLVAQSKVEVKDLFQPLFLLDGKDQKIPIESMPGQFRYSQDQLLGHICELRKLGLNNFVIFPVCDDSAKDPKASEAVNPNHFYLQSISKIKDQFEDVTVMTDIALDPYSSDGHDGLVCPKTGKILNDETLELLATMARLQAKAGADILGPSDMMDGRVGVIRDALEAENFKDTLIMSYTAKFASAFYGPFRDALDSAPKSGDKKTYQLDYRNWSDSMLEGQLDLEEGADILMVKPGIAYLDIICRLSQKFYSPISVYQVSGEYSMIKAAGERGWIDENQVMLESLAAFKRSGASMILSYFSEHFARLQSS